MAARKQSHEWFLSPFEKSELTSKLALRGRLGWTGAEISLRFEVTGPIDQIEWPVARPAPGAFTLDLWKQTCFEFFLGIQGEADYTEWNFSPSGDWARFDFNDYRKAAPLPARDSGIAEFSFGRDSALAKAELRLWPGRAAPRLAWALQNGVALRAGINAVIAARNGERSHWALAHAADRADFHAAANFALLIT